MGGGGRKQLKSDPKSQKHRNTQNFSSNSYVNNQKFSITVGSHPLPPARASLAGNIEKAYKIYEFCGSVVFHGLFSSKRIFVIQASSAESGRHFFADGMIVSERRNLLSAQSDELLVILREAFING